MQLIKAGLVEPVPGHFCGALGGETFHKSYVSLDRLEGMCRLIILWKNRARQREFKMHSFVLRFNHEGISEHRIETIRGSGRETDLNTNLKEYVPVTLLEAAALVQDAYRQNLRFNTCPAGGINRNFFLLEYDTGGVDRSRLLDKLSAARLTPGMFVHVYLAAFRRMDNGLLYDFSSEQRRRQLGPREDFLLDYGEEYRSFTFLKTGIAGFEIKEETGFVKTFAVIITPQEDIVKITFNMRLLISGERFLVDLFEEESRRGMTGDDPENPFNYEVFCSIYSVSGMDSLKRWLDSDPKFFLSGEQHNFLSYKRLDGGGSACRGFDITDRINCEAILSQDEMVVFAKNSQNLVQLEKLAAVQLCGAVKLRSKYHLPVQFLYEHIYNREPGRKLVSEGRSGWRKYRAVSALVYLGDCPVLPEWFRQQAKIKMALGEGTWYYFGQEGHSGIREYYLSGSWLVLYAYRGKLLDEVERLQKDLRQRFVVYDYEIENYYDLFNPPLSGQKKWLIYGMVQKFCREKRLLTKIAFIPSLKEVVKKMGGVVKTAHGKHR
ncbi:MAG: hypothetical protein QHH10_05345 [Peptococcaceae bacterium]|nr:hypothetical protein [Peptococcaceae bacterium]MDH7524724.1 hypothetical protein [Peptococcaceae bacterium]